MTANHMQALVDGLSAGWMKERAETQMTLGGLIDTLAALPEGAEVDCIGEPHSYRGYYSDLSFEPASGKRSASELLAECCESLGQKFEGYKGGDYYMHRGVPVWIAHYGCCGLKIMALRPDGTFETAEDES